MSFTPESNTPSTSHVPSRTPASRRFIISAEGEGTVIRSIPAPRPAPRPSPGMEYPLPEARPADTAADDPKHLIHMRRFLRTALDRTHR